MWILIGLMVLGAISLVFYLYEKIKKYSIKEVLIKTFISFLFVMVAVIASYIKSGHIINIFIILGLLFGLSGDIWLDLKYVYPKDDKIYSYSGFIVFGIGHILYVTGMYLEFFNSAHPLYVILPICGSVLCAVAVLFVGKLLKLDFKDMKLISFLYSMTLFSTPLCALSLSILYGMQNTTLLMLFIGGILFAISDLVLSQTYFGENHEKPLDFILNYLTYYPAQFVIAFSLFFLF